MPETPTTIDALTVLIRHLRPTPDELAEAAWDAVEYDRGYDAAVDYTRRFMVAIDPGVCMKGAGHDDD